MARRKTQFTIFDVLENKGYFDINPANAQSDDYKGPEEYPKMLFHPTGDTRVIVPAEIIVTPLGPRAVGEKSELLYCIVTNEAEELEKLKDGWHDSPSKSMAAAKAKPKPVDATAQIADLERQLNEAKAALLAASRPTGASVAAPSQKPN